MSKTKLTAIEAQNLIAFGGELDRRMKQARIGFAELSKLTDGAVSTGYISDIVRAGRGDSQKYFRLGREKVAILARALSWDEDEALDSAGFKSSREQTEETGAPDDRAAEAARAAELIENFLTLPLEKQTQLLAIIRVLQTDHPELLAPPIRIVKAEDLIESDVEKDTG